MKLTRAQQRIGVYIGGIAVIVGGGVLAKLVDASAGAALVLAGGYLIGAIQKEMLPHTHRRFDDKTPVVEVDPTKSAQ